MNETGAGRPGASRGAEIIRRANESEVIAAAAEVAHGKTERKKFYRAKGLNLKLMIGIGIA